jgi:hypothetical protein
MNSFMLLYRSPKYFSHSPVMASRYFTLDKGSLKQRIVQLLGNQYNAKLVNVQEKQIISIFQVSQVSRCR